MRETFALLYIIVCNVQLVIRNTAAVDTNGTSMDNSSKTTTATIFDVNVGITIEAYNDSSYNQTKQQLLSSVEISAIVLVGLMVPFIIIGNILVMTVVIRFKRLQIPTNYFIVSLAATDILIGITIPLVTATEILGDTIQSAVLCMSSKCAVIAMCGVSVLNLTAIACDRYLAVANPLEYATMLTLSKIMPIIACSWLYSALIGSSPLMGWHHELSDIGRCSFKLIHKDALILISCALFVPACLVIFFCYFRIYMVARHHARAIAAVETSVRHNLEMHFIIKDTKYAKTLAIVIGVFLILWLPIGILVLIEISTDVYLDPWLRNFLSYLAFLNSGINPWIYAYKNNDFRAAYKRLYREIRNNCSGTRANHRRGSTASNTSGFHESTSALSRTNSRLSGFDLRRLRMYSARNSVPEDCMSVNTTRTRLSTTEMFVPKKTSTSSKKVLWTTDTVFPPVTVGDKKTINALPEIIQTSARLMPLNAEDLFSVSDNSKCEEDNATGSEIGTSQRMLEEC